MTNFSLEKYLENPTRKVIDDDGFPVTIISTTANEKCPVVYLNKNGIAFNVTADGKYDSDPNHGIFFAEDEDSLIDFENTITSRIIGLRLNHIFDSSPNADAIKDFIKRNSSKILEAAREELEKTHVIIPKGTYYEICDKVLTPINMHLLY